MENKTGFDLNRAIENWRKELAAQSCLTPESRHELEMHLEDAIGDLQQRGLSEAESFWLAQQRIGYPAQLGVEFVKADPTLIWRDRIFWMAVALVGSYGFMTWKDLLTTWLEQSAWTEIFYLLPLFSLAGAVFVIRRGRVPGHTGFISSWKPAGALLAFLVITVLTAYVRGKSLRGDNMLAMGYNLGLILSWFGNAVWPAVAVLALLFTIKRNKRFRVSR